MVKISFDPSFKIIFSKIKDKSLKTRILKQISKIKDNPEIGKPMKYVRKGTREVYIPPYRLSYVFDKNKDIVVILDIYHKDEQ
jgi:mRNA-degrading endonuclease RelE of RelBE toxin-antitoxin system